MEKHVYSILAIDLDEGITERTEKEQPEYPLKYIHTKTQTTTVLQTSQLLLLFVTKIGE